MGNKIKFYIPLEKLEYLLELDVLKLFSLKEVCDFLKRLESDKKKYLHSKMIKESGKGQKVSFPENNELYEKLDSGDYDDFISHKLDFFNLIEEEEGSLGANLSEADERTIRNQLFENENLVNIKQIMDYIGLSKFNNLNDYAIFRYKNELKSLEGMVETQTEINKISELNSKRIALELNLDLINKLIECQIKISKLEKNESLSVFLKLLELLSTNINHWTDLETKDWKSNNNYFTKAIQDLEEYFQKKYESKLEDNSKRLTAIESRLDTLESH